MVCAGGAGPGTQVARVRRRLGSELPRARTGWTLGTFVSCLSREPVHSGAEIWPTGKPLVFWTGGLTYLVCFQSHLLKSTPCSASGSPWGANRARDFKKCYQLLAHDALRPLSVLIWPVLFPLGKLVLVCSYK